MSKFASQRGDTAVSFIYTARQLSKRIKVSCANANHKKFTFYGLQDLSRYSSDLCLQLMQLNRINPRSKMEADARRLLLSKARGTLDAIVSLFAEVDDIIGFSEGVIAEIGDLMEKEDRLLAGLQKSDNERFKDLR